MAGKLSLFSELKLFAGFARGFTRYLRKPLTPSECRLRLQYGLQHRETGFLDILENGVYAIPNSPYRKLLAKAQITLGDLKESVQRFGLEKTLERLQESGVYLSLDEFKGRKPVRRGDLELNVTARDFDNPLTERQIVSQTGGSRSTGARLNIDLAHFEQDAVYDHFSDLSFGLPGRPHALWRPLPPFLTGLKHAMSYIKISRGVERWFSQNRCGLFSQPTKHFAMTTFAIHASRLLGRALPMPEHVPLNEAWRIANWLAQHTADGTPAQLSTNVASAVRVVLAAKERRFDISGTFFVVGGEPLTAARAAVIEGTGCEVTSHYAMGEQGRIGNGCAFPNAADDVHILLDKVAVIQREKVLAPGVSVPGNLYTTLIRTPPKLMLNVECDDYGVLERRACDCILGKLGYSLHFHSIRSYEKLTSEGMNFLGSDLLTLVEEILPASFGGDPMDYQFLETEEQGLPKVNLVISPRVGDVDEESAVARIIDFLNQCSGGNQYGERWREGNTLRVLRREPSTTPTWKVHALHIASPTPQADQG